MSEQNQTSAEVNYFPTIEPIPGDSGGVVMKDNQGRTTVTVRFEQHVGVVVVHETVTASAIQWSRRSLADNVSLTATKPSMQLQTDRLIMRITDLCSPFIPSPDHDAQVSRPDLIVNLVKESLQRNAPDIHAELSKKCLNVLVTNIGSMETVNIGAYASTHL